MRSAIPHRRESEDSYSCDSGSGTLLSPLVPCTNHAEEFYKVRLCCREPRLSHRPRYHHRCSTSFSVWPAWPRSRSERRTERGHGEVREQGCGDTQSRWRSGAADPRSRSDGGGGHGARTCPGSEYWRLGWVAHLAHATVSEHLPS